MFRHAQRYFLTGILTAIPILVTLAVFQFFLGQLSNFGRPTVRVIAKSVGEYSPTLGRWLLEVPWLQSTIAVLLTVAAIYLLGWAVSRIVGRRVLTLLEALLARIPLVTKVYGSTKQLIQAFQRKPEGGLQRVVLIEFPHKDMKAVGFVTQTFVDTTQGMELAAVYVPTTPNPTSGYLEIVPSDRLVSLDWTMDEAMTFIISGGTVSPGRICFTNPAVPVAGTEG
ncbi:MAG: DUF502 domain-containing protein [Chromatiaceae bacterium]|jgi:uncharacterized membrane protein|nr:DUF502 domain-containing protein [Chromatiaceae bacterium]